MLDRSILLQEKLLGFTRLVRKEYPNGWQCPTHAHEDAHFVFVVNGSFSERYENKDRECKPFSLIFRPPGERHSEIYHQNQVVCISAVLNARWVEGLRERKIDLNSSLHATGSRIIPILSKLNEELCCTDDVSDLSIEMLLYESAIELYRHSLDARRFKKSDFLLKAEEYIRDNAYGKLTLKEIASAAGVHPVYLARAFRGRHKCTVAEYIRAYRVETARARLSFSKNPLADIAHDTGFSDQSHFSRIFKRLTGMTPAQYRINFGKRG